MVAKTLRLKPSVAGALALKVAKGKRAGFGRGSKLSLKIAGSGPAKTVTIRLG